MFEKNRGEFYALIVGNDVYDPKVFVNLNGAVRDAEKLAKFFEKKLPGADGYQEEQVHVTLLKNPTSEQVRKKFNAIVKHLDDSSVFVFYFAGHGLCLPGMDKPSLLCSDAMEALKYGAVSAGEISPQFIAATSRDGWGDMLFIFDACRNNIFVDRSVSAKQTRMRGLCRDAVSKRGRDRNSGNRCTLCSCGYGEQANDDGDFINSVIGEWTESLQNGAGLAVGWEFASRVSQRLRAKRCRQRPEFKGDSFALTPGAGTDGAFVRLLQTLRATLVAAATGIAIALIVLAAILFLPKLLGLRPAGNDGPGSIATPDAPASPRAWSGRSNLGASETFLSAGWDAYNKEDYKIALEKAETVLSLEPANASAQELSIRAKTGLASRLVVKGKRALDSEKPIEALNAAIEASTYDSENGAAASLRNEAKNATLVAAKRALDVGEYSEAKRLAQAVLDVVKTDGYATLILNDAQTGLEKRSNVATLLTSSRRLLTENKLDEALKKVEETLALDPGNSSAKGLKGEIEKKREDAHFAKLTSDGWNALSSGDFDEAEKKATAAKNLRPNDPNAANLQAQIKKKREDAESKRIANEKQASLLAEEGERLRQSGDLTEAYTKTRDALTLDSSCKAALDLKSRIAADLREKESNEKQANLLAEEGMRLLQSDPMNGWKEASKKARDALALDPSCQAALNLQEAIKRRIRVIAQAMALNRNIYENAVKSAKDALTLNPENKLAKDYLEEATGWGESSSRKAGTRQTLKIGNAEYGFRWIPAGEFDMGSPKSEQEEASAGAKKKGFNIDYSDEKLHHVKLTHDFWALETEVTQALYQEIMGENPSRFKGADLPVEMVSWDDAQKFCAELTKRLPAGLKASLPTEAQWEYMARAGTKTAYWYGDSADSGKMNYNNNKGKTTPVKSYAPNAWGLYDVSGNVWEWCLDYFGDYPTGTVIDPKGPNSASSRVNRGGSWGGLAGFCRSACRFNYSPGVRFNYLGFRFLLVCD